MKPLEDHVTEETRRHFFRRSALGLGSAALSSLILNDVTRADPRRPHRQAYLGCHTLRQVPSGRSTCLWPAHPRRWICSTISPE